MASTWLVPGGLVVQENADGADWLIPGLAVVNEESTGAATRELVTTISTTTLTSTSDINILRELVASIDTATSLSDIELITADISKQISLGTDDCYEQDDTTATLDTVSVYVGYLDPNAYDVGLRWQSINMAQGSTITSAKLSIYVHADTGTLSANIRGIDEDNTLTWATDNRPSQRTKTTATINANEANWSNWGASQWADIDITSIIQEIIDRGGWSANNDLAIVIEDTSGTGANYTAMRAYELAGNLHGAKLDIEYTDAEATIPILLHLYNQMRQ